MFDQEIKKPFSSRIAKEIAIPVDTPFRAFRAVNVAGAVCLAIT
uniref:Uncharacterized protein n=1 Tax=Arundo donax TaxID=35708 RepID=A0A0A8ZE39_ARUDO